MEILGACCHDTETLAPSDWSFTTVLTEVLEQSSEKPLTMTMLHEKLMSSRVPTKKYIRLKNGVKVVTKTPVHCIIATGDKASIRLCMVRGSQSPADLGPSDILPPPQSSTGSPAQILVAVSVTGDDHNVQDWSEWLATHMPKEVTKLRLVKAEGVYGGNSTLITLAIPVAVWNLLRYSSAYRSIGYITTPNKLTEGLKVRDSKSPWESSEPTGTHLKPADGNSSPLKRRK